MLAGVPCRLSELRASLSNAQRTELDDLIADGAVTGTAIVRVVERVFGVELPNDTIGRHRRGDCRRCGAA